MKKVWTYCKMPLIVAVIACIIYIIDSFLGPALVEGGSFMWVAFVSWTIFFGVSIKERLQALIGNIIGFGFGLLMWHSSSFFSGNLGPISIAGLLFVFIANGAMMFFPNFKKLWLHSISGIFMGVFLTFSGLGVNLAPVSVSNAFLMLGIILIYSMFGLIAGFLCIKLNTLNKNETQEVTVISNNEGNKE